MKRLTIRFFLFFNCAGLISSSADAQKLPKVQRVSLRAPGNIKIDGKATEWNNHFQAYNPNNRLYYTISNDEENLYLLVQSSDGYSSEKALFGIKLTINLPDEKTESQRKVSQLLSQNTATWRTQKK